MGVLVVGSINMDVVARVRELPRPGETVMGTSIDYFPGGKGANQAIASARLGAQTALLGAVGEDEFGDSLRDYLESAGVDISQVAVKEGSETGRALIFVSEHGENVIVVISGANHAIGVDDISATLPASRNVLLTQLETPLQLIEHVYRMEEFASACRIINAAPAIAAGRRLFALADIVIVNEEELQSYCGQRTVATDDAGLAAQARTLLGDEGPHTIILTLGARGALAVTQTDTMFVRGREVPVVDTTGAGDCFCGCLAAALSTGSTLAEAMELATVAASLSVQRHGAAASMPERDEVLAALATP